MRVRLLAALASAITLGTGFIVVAGLILRDGFGLNVDIVTTTQNGADVLLQLATITIALTIVIGIVNLVAVHARRVFTRQRGLFYSLVLLLSFGAVIVTYIADRESSLVLLETVQLSVESALAGVLFFALVYGAYRMMRDRVTWTAVLFTLVLLVVLIAALPLQGIEPLKNLREWLYDIPVSAGARGLLLGIALATLVTGVRVLVGIDRSYRE
jgi:hypothetical protein